MKADPYTPGCREKEKKNVARRVREVSVKNSDVEGLDGQELRGGLMNTTTRSAYRVMETAVREVNSRVNKSSFTLSVITF